jgi:phosphoserine phosphatase
MSLDTNQASASSPNTGSQNPSEPFSALIILATEDKPGVLEELQEVLAPFALTIAEIQKIALRGRLILGVLIHLDPAHALAIEDDLQAFGAKSGYDVAMDYRDL